MNHTVHRRRRRTRSAWARLAVVSGAVTVAACLGLVTPAAADVSRTDLPAAGPADARAAAAPASRFNWGWE